MLTKEWRGWHIAHCAAEDKIESVFDNPGGINWQEHLIVPLKRISLDVKFLRIGKLFLLEHDIEAEKIENETGRLVYPFLETPVVILTKEYDYGTFINGTLPTKRDVVLKSFYGELTSLDKIKVSLKEFKLIPNELDKLGARNKIVKGRRQDAQSWIIQRAEDIDLFVAGVVAEYGEEALENMGLKNLNLTLCVREFFEKYGLFMNNYIQSGSLVINTWIQKVLDNENPKSNAWLKEKIPLGRKPDGSLDLVVAGEKMIELFEAATIPVTPSEIEQAWQEKLAIK